MAMIREKTISGKIFSKKMCFRSAPEVKRDHVSYKITYFSRKYPVAEKLEQLEQNRKKHLKAHLTGYQSLPISFEL